MFPVFSDLRV